MILKRLKKMIIRNLNECTRSWNVCKTLSFLKHPYVSFKFNGYCCSFVVILLITNHFKLINNKLQDM